LKNILLISVLILITIVMYGVCDARETPVVVEEADYIMYTIKPGDTLYKIALKYGTTITEIKILNNLYSDLIYAWEQLKIPQTISEDYLNYYVKPGDSLYFLSLRYNTTIQKIKDINGIQSNIIYIGQRLMIPTNEVSYGSVAGIVKIYNNSTELKTNIEISDSNSLLTNDDLFEYEESEIIVKYKANITGQAVNELEKGNDLINISQLMTPEGLIIKYNLPEDRNINDVLKNYRQINDVAWAEPNYIYYPTAIPEDDYYEYQWNLVNINMEGAWDVEKGDNSVVVALLDTGIIPDHPDLQEHLLPGADFVDEDDSPVDETTRDPGGSHGTHVAGIIGAITNNCQGIAGINWSLKILPVRVLKRTGGTSWDIVEGIYYALDQGADVINLSLGGKYKSVLQEEAIKKAVDSGVTVIAATGNEASSVYYPAALKETIAVGAVKRDNNITSYSNIGPEVDIVAPGGGYGESIYSTWGYYEDGMTTPGYIGMIGTSMATPHVSGIAALLVAHGIKGPENIRSRLLNTANDLGTPGKDDYYGYGLVDAYAALLGKRFSEPEVFAAVKEGNTLRIKSEVKKVNNDGSFELEKVNVGNVYLIIWRDVNENGLIDRGDYYGETDKPLYITRDKLIKNVELNGYYLADKTKRLIIEEN